MKAKYFGEFASPILENSNEKSIENSSIKKKQLYENYIAGEDSLSKYMTNQRRLEESEEKQERIGVELNHSDEENKFNHEEEEEDDDED